MVPRFFLTFQWFESFHDCSVSEITCMDICRDDDRSGLLRVLGKHPCAPEAMEKTGRPTWRKKYKIGQI